MFVIVSYHSVVLSDIPGMILFTSIRCAAPEVGEIW